MKKKLIIAAVLAFFIAPLVVEAAVTIPWQATTTGASTITPVLNNGVASSLAVNGSATSTYANGINVATGCLAINGVCITGGGSGTPGGASSTIQYNANGAFAGNTGLTYDGSKLTATGFVNAPGFNVVGNATPQLGLYSSSGNVLSFAVNTTDTFNMTSSVLASATAGGGAFLTAATSGTSPAFAPNKSDLSSGLGSPSAGVVSLITNATERLTVANGGNIGAGSTTPGSLFSIGSAGTGTNFYNNATTSKDGVGGYNITQGCYAVAGTCITGGSSSAFGYLFPGNATNTPLTFNGGLTAANNVTLSGITGSTQCLHVNSSGVISGTGTDCGSSGGSVTGVTATYPIISSGGTAPVISTAFGTTTANTFSNTQTFSVSPTFSTLSAGTVNANSAGGIYNTPTTTPSAGTGISFSAAPGGLIGGANFTITNTGVTSLVAGTNITLSGSTGAVTVNATGGGSGTVGTGTQGQFPFYNANGTTLTATSSLFIAQSGNIGVASTSPIAPLSIVGEVEQYGTAADNGFSHFGLVPSDDSVYCAKGKQCFGYFGNDNTEAGTTFEVGNTTTGTHGYAGYDITNSLAADGSGLHYAGPFLSSATYADCTFGTGLCSPSQLQFSNSDGRITIETASTTDPVINFLTGGAGTGNEIGRFNLSSFLVGTTTGLSSTIGTVVVHPQTNTANALAITNSVGTTTFSAGTSDAVINSFSVSTSTQANGLYEFAVDARGHVLTGGAAPTCGAGCTSVMGDDNNFRAITGAGVTAVTINFANTWVNSSGTSITPVCNSSDESGGTTVSDASSTPSSVTMNLSASLTSKNLAVSCMASNNFTQ